jgi:hypothetical protein
MEREAVEEVQREQREEAAEEAGCGVGLGDVTPPVPSGCADQDACYRSIEAAVERFFPGEAAASEGYNQSSIPASSSGVWSGRSLNASVPPSGETSEGAREIDLCGDGVPEPAKDESGHLCEGAKDVSKITNQSSYPKTVRYQVSHLISQAPHHQASDFTYQYEFQTQHGNPQDSQQQSDISNPKPHTSIVKSQSISATAARFLIFGSCYMGFRF